MHPNNLWLIQWASRMIKKFGQPDDNFDWCRKLAYFMGEEGTEHPSDAAIETAKQWEATEKHD